MQTENLKSLRELRAQEKAIKASIETVKPLAIEEAKALAPEGGKFSLEGIGEFVLDKDPVLNISTSTSEEAVEYRKLANEQKKLKEKVSGLTKKMRGFYDAFKAKFAHKATKFTYTLKCVGLD